MKCEIVRKRLQESIQVKQNILQNDVLIQTVYKLAEDIVLCFRKNGKIVLCGNGGSASDALHFAGEIVGKFQRERSAWPAVVLNSNVATMTAIANDYGYDEIYAHQAEGHVKPEDIFIGISTSGNSKNICRAAEVSKQKGAKTVAFTGKDGGMLRKIVDYPIIIPCQTTARVQECHITLIHIICELVENGYE